MKWALLANVLFALVDLSWKQAQSHNSVIVNTAIRSLASVGLLWILMLAAGLDFALVGAQWKQCISTDFRALGIGVLGWMGLWCFGKALRDGPLHTIIPLVAMTPVFTYLFWYIQHNSGPMPLESLAILMAMTAGIWLSFRFQRKDEKNSALGPINWGLLASLSWGLSYSWYEGITRQMGALPTATWVEICIATASLLAWISSTKSRPKGLVWPLLTGLLTAFAVAATVQSYAEHGTESTAIAGVLTPLLSIAGAWMINRERPRGGQWISVLLLLFTLIWQALRLP